MVNGSRAKIGRDQTVKALFGRSKILTAVAALDTAPMGVTSPCSVTVAGEMNEVVAIYKFSSVFVFEIACFSTSTGFSWDHHGIFATLSSRLVKKNPGHKYYFVLARTQAGHRSKFRDCPGQTGTLGNYEYLLQQ